MVSAGDEEETQVLDIDSSPSGTRFDDPIADDRDEGIGQDFPLGETLPLDSLIGDTQVLEDPDCVSDGVHGDIDASGKTQLVDDEYEETAAASNDGDDDDGTERTEALSDDEGLQDDGATSGGVDIRWDESNGGSEERPTGHEQCNADQGETEVVVDSDASTDEEGGGGDHVSSALLLSGDSRHSNHGSARKSFTAVRAASLRCFGLAAAQNITSETIDTVSKSSLINGEYSKRQDAAVGIQTGTKSIVAQRRVNSTGDPTSLDTTACVDNDNNFENPHWSTLDYHRDETQSRINNPRIRKLFNEVTPPRREETTSKAENVMEKADSPHLVVSDYVVGGLSYLESQEPGDMSQANALGVVDKFLLVNDVGSSQEFKTGKTDVVKSPPISSTKGAQSLAKKADHRSPVGKKKFYDWIDSLEDEGGGEFFSKRKDTFFGSRDGARKAHSQPPEARHRSSGIIIHTTDKSSEKEGVNSKTHLKLTSLTCSDSRLMLHNVPRNKKVHISETKTKKNLFKNMDGQSDSKYLEQKLVASDVDGDEECMYDVGPDTQMAAEAIEALLHGSPVNYEMKEGSHPGATKVTENLSKGAKNKRNSSEKNSLQKRTATPESEGIITRSKRSKMLSAKSRSGKPNISRKCTSNSRAKKNLENITVDTKAKREKRKVEGNLNARSSVNRNESSRSLNREMAQGMVDETFTAGVDNRRISLTSKDKLSVRKELILGEHHIDTTPVAHRTRHSRAVDLVKQTETISEHGKDKNGLMDDSTHGTMTREDKLVSDASAVLEDKREGSNIGSVQTAPVEKNVTCHREAHEIGELREEEPEISSLIKDSLSHPKRRRTSQIISGDPKKNGNLNNPYISVDGMPATTVQPSTRGGKAKIFVRSVSEILATAKKKRRSVSTQKASRSDGIPPDTRKMLIISGVRTRSSVNPPPFKPCLEKDSMKYSSKPVLHKAGSTDEAIKCSDVVMNHSVLHKEVELTNESVNSASYLKDAEGNPKLDVTPKEKVQLSDLPCSTPLKAIDAVSPVVVGRDPPRTLCNKSLSRSSIVRELNRLEAFGSSQTWMPKDLRRRKDMASIRVLFSHHLDEDTIKQQKKILARLGVPTASSMSDATHFVTDKFVRTRNMLEAMALGKPVVTPLWLESCGQASCFIDEKNYILRDSKKEKEIGFSMPVSLAHACRCPLLQGRRVFITPNTKPDRELLASLVKAAHGQPLERIGRSATKDNKVPDDLLVLSCEEDFAICKPVLEKGTEVFSSELLLNGIVIQKLQYERHQLFSDHVKRTRSTIWLRREDGDQFLAVTKCT